MDRSKFNTNRKRYTSDQMNKTITSHIDFADGDGMVRITALNLRYLFDTIDNIQKQVNELEEKVMFLPEGPVYKEALKDYGENLIKHELNNKKTSIQTKITEYFK